jgi:SpoIID/LytB domain protein
LSTTEKTVEIHAWTPGAQAEPSVRIGVILEQDGCDKVDLVMPDAPCLITGGEAGGGTGGGVGSRPIPPGSALHIERNSEGLTLHTAEGSIGPADRLRVNPKERTPSEPGAGILVRSVVAGRGFHWQKKADQTLLGSLEFVAAPGGIVMVNELPLEDYLVGVITAEMGGACPVEFLKAQCVVARSWLLAMAEPKHGDDPFDRCNDDCCQRYQGTGDMSRSAIDAVRGTRGLVLIDPAGRVLDANYAKSCGGVSELAEHVWGQPKPGISAVVDAPADDPVQQFMPVTEDNLDAYLDGDWLAKTRAFCSTHAVPVETISRYLGRVDEVDDYFRWTVNYTRAELESLLRDKLPEASGLAQLRGLRVTSRGVSGRAIRVELKWTDQAGAEAVHILDSEYRIREVLHRGFLYSSAFAARIQRNDTGEIHTVTLRGAGWGHGAGLCQIGALGMGLAGHGVDAICLHYYPQAVLQAVYP